MTDKELFEDYYTLEDVAKLMGISVKTLKNRIGNRKNHPPILPGNRVSKEAFREWEAKQATRQKAS